MLLLPSQRPLIVLNCLEKITFPKYSSVSIKHRPHSLGRVKSQNRDSTWLERLADPCAKASERWKEQKFKSAISAQLDFRYPAEWFPTTRLAGPRKIFCHVGPTNSGKTHAAIQRLKQAERGIYCAPLRLLAVEMWEKLNSIGKRCALRTGEATSGPIDDPEVDYSSIGTLACTVEMLDTSREFDVAVIDEFQMVSDEQRGWAFTQALLGVKAKEIYVCGEEAAVSLIQKIALDIGDKVEVIRYSRLSPLSVAEKSLGGKLQNLKPGDCVVAFSRKKIFETKYLIEKETGKKCAVVYGNLPMENRTLQAKAFNERQQGVQIMVASDAIGMGLNLNIQRIVFHGVKQASPDGLRLVPPSRIKQIGGRAGRFGFGNAQGIVTCLHDSEMDYLRECMNTPNEEYEKAGLAPPSAIIESLSHQFPELPLISILSAVTEAGKYGSSYVPCISKEQKLIAFMLEDFTSLSVAEKLVLSSAPVQLRNCRILNSFQWFVSCLAARKPCPLRVNLGHHQRPMDFLELAESFYRTLDLYLWLGLRFPETFIEVKEVMKQREFCKSLVTKLLAQITTQSLHDPSSALAKFDDNGNLYHHHPPSQSSLPLSSSSSSSSSLVTTTTLPREEETLMENDKSRDDLASLEKVLHDINAQIK